MKPVTLSDADFRDQTSRQRRIQGNRRLRNVMILSLVFIRLFGIERAGNRLKESRVERRINLLVEMNYELRFPAKTLMLIDDHPESRIPKEKLLGD